MKFPCDYYDVFVIVIVSIQSMDSKLYSGSYFFRCSHFESPTETDQVRTGKSKITLMNKIIQAYVQVHLVKLV